MVLTILPTLDVAAIRREIVGAAGALPVLLWILAAAGTLWADVSWAERLNGLGGFNRMLAIPLLFAQFRRSERGIWVLYGYFVSVVALLATSWALVLIPGLSWRGKVFGVPVKDYIFQSESFLICAFVLLGRALAGRRAKGVLGGVDLLLVSWPILLLWRPLVQLFSSRQR